MRTIRYVDEDIPVDIPSKNVIFDLAPENILSGGESRELIGASLAHSIGTPPLREMARPGQRVAIIVDDNTRLTPLKLILPIILDELHKAGTARDDIRIVIASGTHRRMTLQEKSEKYGDAILSQVRFLDHDCKDPAKLVDYGTSDSGGTHVG
jgi:nickel-dependent lactate racemase